MPLEVDDDDYDVEASIRETFANINAELPDFGKEFEEKVDEIPVEEVETIVEDHSPETADFAEEPVITAYCLDGGQTGEVVFRGEPYNHVDFGAERNVSDIIYFATAVSEGVTE